ncbi:MAG: flagellar basal body P-ring formation protein FlgA [Candidatus Omnitrophica bacterium]|nr:flagellar basal body P-ring formation protein FlgA [Candidatus Omnitrophota bacterium]
MNTLTPIRDIIKVMAVLMIVCITVCHSTESVAAPEIMMKDHVIVQGESVFVNDIAVINTADMSFSKELGEVFLCKAPRAGYEREINRAFLIMKLRQNKIDTDPITFGGSMYTSVTVEEYVISADQQKSALTAWLSQKLDLSMDAFKVVYRKEPRDIVVPAEEIDILFKGDEATFYTRSCGIYMELYAEERMIKRSSFNFSLELLQDVVVPTRFIRKDEVINEEDVTVEQRFIAAYDRTYAMSVDKVVGCLATKELVEANIVSEKDICLRTIVERGEAVECLLADKNMNMRLSLQACENGVKGDIIRLYNPETEKTVRGVIIGDSRVELMI